MATNYILLEKITVGAVAASSVTFSNIPQTGYSDLLIKVSARSSTNNTYDDLQAKFNGVSLSYENKNLSGPGNGIAVGSGSNAYTTSGYCGTITALTATANTFGNGDIYIPNYTSANKKPFSCDFADERNVSTGVYSSLNANLWSNTAAITTIQFTAAGGDLVQYSTFSLYGVAALGTTPLISPKATGGDTIMTDGTYWYHAFKASGTFTPVAALTCDYLVVAGGGGGNNSGGGAGGFRTATSQSLTATNYTVTIGAGGNGQPSTATAGSTSTINSFSASGGGKGVATTTGFTGGSGSGGAENNTGGAGNAGSYSPVEGYAGGTGTGMGYAGGGGAGGVGGNTTSNTTGGVGGVGSSTAISGGATTGAGQLSGGVYYFAGGGGGAGSINGCAGGLGGGGAGAYAQAGIGTANTGGAGGGTWNGNPIAANGGSGIVIVRYAV